MHDHIFVNELCRQAALIETRLSVLEAHDFHSSDLAMMAPMHELLAPAFEKKTESEQEEDEFLRRWLTLQEMGTEMELETLMRRLNWACGGDGEATRLPQTKAMHFYFQTHLRRLKHPMKLPRTSKLDVMEF